MNTSRFYFFSFLVLFLAQVLLFRPVQLWGEVHLLVYILFPLLFNQNANKILVLFLSFALGLLIDLFSNTIGLHSSALLFIAFIRPTVLAFFRFKPNGSQILIRFSELTFYQVISYLFLMICIHQIYILILNHGSQLSGIHLLSGLKNSLFSLLTIRVVAYLFEPKKNSY
ncbi:MAG: hypothetical protein ACPGTG_07370 [Flavobacteriales bacterium]